MNCSEADYLAPLYWSNELDANTLRELEAHLKACPECAREWQAQSQFDELLRDTFAQNVPDTRELRARVRHEMYADRRVWNRIFAVPRWRLAAVTLLAVLAVMGLFSYFSRQNARERSLYLDAADDHRQEVVLRNAELEWLRSPADVQKLLHEHVGNGDLMPSLAPRGYHFDRARLCELTDQIYVHLVYTDNRHEVSVFVRRNNGPVMAGRTVATVNGRGLHSEALADLRVAGFQSQNLNVLLVTDLPAPDCVNLARDVASQV